MASSKEATLKKLLVRLKDLQEERPIETLIQILEDLLVLTFADSAPELFKGKKVHAPLLLVLSSYNKIPGIQQMGWSLLCKLIEVCPVTLEEISASQDVEKDWEMLSFHQRLECSDKCVGVLCLDYCNSLYAGMIYCALQQLQRVQSAASQVITGTPRREHIIPALFVLHWLPISFRVVFKVAALAHRVFYLDGLEYLQDKLPKSFQLRNLRSNDLSLLQVPRTKKWFYSSHNRSTPNCNTGCCNLPSAVCGVYDFWEGHLFYHPDPLLGPPTLSYSNGNSNPTPLKVAVSTASSSRELEGRGADNCVLKGLGEQGQQHLLGSSASELSASHPLLPASRSITQLNGWLSIHSPASRDHILAKPGNLRH